VLDSCVLYPPGLRNLLMWLAVEGVLDPRWTDEIHEEWIRNALEDDAKKNTPPRLDRARLERTRDLMNRHAERSLVTGYERHIAALALPDPNDRHVLAAAIQSGAEAIVTFNDRHFPDAVLAPFNVRAVKPDAFLCDRFDADPETFLRAVRALLDSLRNPPMSLDQLSEGWERAGLPLLARRVR